MNKALALVLLSVVALAAAQEYYEVPVAQARGDDLETAASGWNSGWKAPSSGWSLGWNAGFNNHGQQGWGWRPKWNILKLAIPIPSIPHVKLGFRTGFKAHAAVH